VFIVTIIFSLWVASALAGLALDLVFFGVLAIVLVSPLVALTSVALLVDHGFGPVSGVLVSIGSLTALQSFYFAGAAMRYLTRESRPVPVRKGRKVGHEYL
jgi:hypothetical protein